MPPSSPDSPHSTAPLPRGHTESPGVRLLARIALWAAAVALALYFLSAVSLVGMSFLAAAAVAAALSPLAKRMPGPLWVRVALTGASLVVTLAALVAVAVWALWSPIAEQWQRWPQTSQKIDATLAHWSHRLGLEQTLTVEQAGEQLLSGLTGGRMQDALTNAVNGVGIGLVAIALLLFGALYLLGGGGRAVQRGLERLLPRRKDAVRLASEDLDHRLRWWLLGTLLSMVVSGTLQGLGYWAVGLDFALAIGIIGGLAEIVPTFGPASVFLLALLLAATQGTSQVIGVIVVYTIVQTLESYLIVPLVMKRAVHIPPLVTLFTVVFWGQVLGLPGLLLAIPLNLVVWTLVERFYLDPRERAAPA